MSSVPLNPDSIRGRIFLTMVQKGISQSELAERLGGNQPTIAGWKAGKAPDADALSRLPEALGVSGHYLLTGKEYGESTSVSKARQQGRREGWAACAAQVQEAIKQTEPTVKLSAEEVEAIAEEVRAARRRAGKGRKAG